MLITSVLCTLLMGACTPNYVEGDAFTLSNGSSELRGYDEVKSIVLVSMDDAEYRSAVLHVPNTVTIHAGSSIPFARSADQGIYLELLSGRAVSEEFGGEIFTSPEDIRTVNILKGSVTFDSIQGVTSGSFEATISDGSAISGYFSVADSIR